MDVLDIRLVRRLSRSATVVAVPVAKPAEALDDAVLAGSDAADAAGSDGPRVVVPVGITLPDGIEDAELVGFLDDADHSGKAGTIKTWARPLRAVSRLLALGVGAGDEAGWRAAGAALARHAKDQDAVSVLVPPDFGGVAARGFAEGAWLGSYRFRLGADAEPPALRRINLVGDGAPEEANTGIATARVTADATTLARNLTNMPSDRKNPESFVKEIGRAIRGVPGLTQTVREPDQLRAEGFGGLLAVGNGSAHGPRLIELTWRPRGAKRHIVLVGKGITFDTGGICIKTREGMKLMRKDMGGAAAVLATTIAAARLGLPVRLTALAPLAENMASGSAMRPGDVVRHYGGLTTEIRNTDAEGRLVLADALGYAAARLRPDLIVDLATLTGAQSVALGKRTAALFSDNDALAKELADAAADVGEQLWRLPLPEDYVSALQGDETDLLNSTEVGAGSVMAALFLREHTGAYRDRWAHLDMSAPAWSDRVDGELVKGATGWGVRTLLRWLA
jgi:leucyl aminopeptidase